MLSMYIKFTKTKTQMNLISLSAPLKLSSWCIIRGQPIIKWRLNEKESLFALFFSPNIEKGRTHKIDSYSSIKTFHSYPSHFTLPHLSHQKIWKGAASNEHYVDVSCHVNILFFFKTQFCFLHSLLWIILIDVLTTISNIRILFTKIKRFINYHKMQ